LKNALTQHILGAVGGDIAHFQVRAGVTRTFRYVLWSCRLHFSCAHYAVILLLC